MLQATPGELWHLVEPAARERPGWVAFAPKETLPTMVAMRSLIPGDDGLSALADHICTVEEARELLSLVNFLDSAYTADGTNADLASKALLDAGESLTLRAALGKRYAAGATITLKDATAVAELTRRSVARARIDAGTDGTLTIADAAGPVYTLVGFFLNRAACTGRPAASGRLKWWIIPLVLIGTALVVHGETRETKR